MVRVVACMMGVALALGAGSAGAKESKAEQRVREMVTRPPEQLMPLLKVKGDELDPAITITSDGVTAVTTKGLLGSFTEEDSFLRAIVDKKTATPVIQVYHHAVYGGTGWNFFNRASYEGPNGLEQVEASRVGTDVSCSKYGCTHYEDVVFQIPLALLDAAAQKYSPSEPLLGLKYRLFGQSGETVDEVIPVNELAAFDRKLHEVMNGLATHTAQ